MISIVEILSSQIFLSKTMISLNIFKKNCSLCSILPFQELAEGLTFIMLSPSPVLEKNSAGFFNKSKTVNLSESKTNQLGICVILYCLLNYKY